MTLAPALPPNEHAARTTLVVAAIFGPTIQGEGPSAGQVAAFLRLGGCNLCCAWCDEPQTWDSRRFDLRAELARTNIEVILSRLLARDTPMIVITGGEPLLHQHQPAWRTLIGELYRAGKHIEIETNGTIEPDAHTVARVARFNVSPKLANSGMSQARRLNPDALRALEETGKAIFKFVCRDAADVDEVAVTIAAQQIPHARTWVMPEGTTPQAVTGALALITDRALAHRFNVTGRMHIMLWGDRRGR